MQGYVHLYREVKNEFARSPKSTAKWDVGNAFAGKYIYRPLGLLAAPIFIMLSISGNGVTMISFLVGTAGNLVFLAGRQEWFLAGALCFVLFAVLDFTDGVVARHEAKSTHFGKMLDLLSGTLVASFVPLCVGFGVLRAGALPSWLEGLGYAFLASLATAINLITKVVSTSFALEVSVVAERRRADGPPNESAPSGLRLLFRRAMFHLTGTTSQLALLVVTLLDAAYLFPLILLLLASLQLVLALTRVFKTGPRLLAIEKS